MRSGRGRRDFIVDSEADIITQGFCQTNKLIEALNKIRKDQRFEKLRDTETRP